MNAQNLIAELDFELNSTGKLLELVLEDKLGWQPHPKAMTLGELAYHVATIAGRYLTFAQEGYTTLDTLLYHAAPKDKAEVLSSFTISNTKAKELLGTMYENWQDKAWSLTKNGEAVFTLPVPLFIRLLVFNHLFHHRGQLSAYLRILNVPIPSIYGPSADENPFG